MSDQGKLHADRIFNSSSQKTKRKWWYNHVRSPCSWQPKRFAFEFCCKSQNTKLLRKWSERLWIKWTAWFGHRRRWNVILKLDANEIYPLPETNVCCDWSAVIWVSYYSHFACWIKSLSLYATIHILNEPEVDASILEANCVATTQRKAQRKRPKRNKICF